MQPLIRVVLLLLLFLELLLSLIVALLFPRHHAMIYFIKTYSLTSVSPQKQKLLRAQNFSIINHHRQSPPLPSLQNYDLSIEEELMPIVVSDNLRQWLIDKGLQGYLKVADADTHPRATKILQRIDVAKITNKQVRHILNLKREGFLAVQKMDKQMLRSYFGEYSPVGKSLSDTWRGR